MIDRSNKPFKSAALFGVLGIGALAAVFLVSTLWSHFRGPDLAYAPSMTAVTLPLNKQLYVQTYEVTVDEWNRCFEDKACSLKLKAPKRQEVKDYPATGLNWFDVQQYLAWINGRSRHQFRLPSSDEWNQLAKEVLPEKPDPIFTDPDLTWASAYLTTPAISRRLRATGSFKTTSTGIHDLDGNVWEWTGDCYSRSGKPSGDRSRCPAYYVGGEHIAAIPIFTRDPARGGCAVGSPPAHLGLRLVTDEPISRRANG